MCRKRRPNILLITTFRGFVHESHIADVRLRAATFRTGARIPLAAAAWTILEKCQEGKAAPMRTSRFIPWGSRPEELGTSAPRIPSRNLLLQFPADSCSSQRYFSPGGLVHHTAAFLQVRIRLAMAHGSRSVSRTWICVRFARVAVKPFSLTKFP